MMTAVLPAPDPEESAPDSTLVPPGAVVLAGTAEGATVGAAVGPSVVDPERPATTVHGRWGLCKMLERLADSIEVFDANVITPTLTQS
mmetsp:Transcript_24971/g.65086  ORF Transcript_24971/g.65086 Transcript_24971/m.65086 type:complete len:88 (+) Transcript_24971:148-411(+)